MMQAWASHLDGLPSASQVLPLRAYPRIAGDGGRAKVWHRSSSLWTSTDVIDAGLKFGAPPEQAAVQRLLSVAAGL